MLLTAGAIVKVKKKMQTKKIARKKWLFDIFKMTYIKHCIKNLLKE